MRSRSSSPGPSSVQASTLSREALILLVVVTGLSQGVLDGQITAAEAFATIDYSLNHTMQN